MHEAADVLGWVEATALAQAMRGWLWLYPIVEILHILGFVTLVGAAAMFDLRLLGVSKNLPVRALARHLLPWSVAGLILVVPAGLMMFSAHATEFAENGVFLLKLSLIALAGVNAAAFRAGVYRTVSRRRANSRRAVARPVDCGCQLRALVGLYLD
jgi:hypothetical protein